MAQYQGRLSGPLIDRIDITLDVPPVSAADLVLPAPKEGSAEVRARVAAARSIQQKRYAALGLEAASTNAAAPSRVLEEVAALDRDGQALITGAAEKMQLTARGFHRVLKVARTIADLDGEAVIRRLHLAEALSYRARMAA